MDAGCHIGAHSEKILASKNLRIMKKVSDKVCPTATISFKYIFNLESFYPYINIIKRDG